jgi:hypothetical protein
MVTCGLDRIKREEKKKVLREKVGAFSSERNKKNILA